MADKWPLANGNWSNAANWNGGTKPVPGDDVYADNRTVTVDENVDIGTGTLRNSARSGGTAGGTFNANSGISITANVIGSVVGSCLNAPASGTLVLNGNVTGGTSASIIGFNIPTGSTTNVTVTGNHTSLGAGDGIQHNGNGVLTVTGNTTGGLNNGGDGIAVNPSGGAGTLNLVGDCTGGSAESSGVLAAGNSTVNIVGTIYGGLGNNSYGVSGTGNSVVNITANVIASTTAPQGSTGVGLNGASTITINGNVTGGGTAATNVGVRINGNGGSVTINGNVIGRHAPGLLSVASTTGNGFINGTCSGSVVSNGAGVSHAGLGTIRIKRAIGNGFGIGSVGLIAGFAVINNGVGVVEIEELEFGDLGMSPVSGPCYIRDLSTNVCLMQRSSMTKKTLVDPSTVGDYPANSNVRLGTVFNFSNNTGTLAVPNPNQVAVGVATDNTVGTAVITAASLRSELGLASANLDTQLAGLSSDIDNITVDNAAIALAVEERLADDFQEVLDAVGNIEVDNAAIALAVESQLADDFQEIVDAIGGAESPVYVYPMSMEQEPRNTHAKITVYTGETGSQYFFAYDSAGTALSLTGKTLEFRVADTKSQQRLYTAKTSDGTLTISLGNKVTFTKSTKFTRFANTDVTYSLRDMDAGGEVLLDGQIELMWAP